MKNLLVLLVLLISAGFVYADDWVPIIGIPDPGWGISTDRTDLYGAASGATYDYTDDDGPLNINWSGTAQGAIAYRLDANGDPYTHYVASDNPNCDDTNNPHGTESVPRCIRPNFPISSPMPAGSVIYVDGGSQSGYGEFYGSGTADKPIFFTGNPNDKPVWTGVLRPRTSYFIWENMKHDLETYARTGTILIGYISSFVDIPNQTNIAVRHCEFYNGQDQATSSYQVIRMVHSTEVPGVVQNIVIHNNYFHDINPNRTTVTRDDAVAINADIGVQYVWAVDNVCERIGGDCLQFAADMLVNQPTGVAPNHIYVGRNTAIDLYEELLDMKMVNDIIVSENYGSSGIFANVPGTDTGDLEFQRHDVWFLFNTMYGTTTSGISAFDRPTNTYWTKDVYAIGNVAYDIHNEDGNAKCFYSSWLESSYWINNTCYNSDTGFIFNGDTGQPYDIDTIVIANNIFGPLHPGSLNSEMLNIYGESDWLDNRVTITNNLYYDNGNAMNFKVYRALISNVTYSSYVSFCAVHPDFCTESLTDNPLFADAPNDDFSLTNYSPAINAGNDTIAQAAYDAFYTRYGIDIAKDAAARTRPIGVHDLGAYEYGTEPEPLGPTIYFNQPEGTVIFDEPTGTVNFNR